MNGWQGEGVREGGGKRVGRGGGGERVTDGG